MVPWVEPGSAAPSRFARRNKEVGNASDLWSRFGQKWQQGPGSHLLPCGRRYIWLERRGTGLGCTLCSWFASRYAEKKPLDRNRRCWTAFARFQVKGMKSMQSCVFRMHVQSDLHQQAWQCWCNPASADTVLSLPDEDRYLLRGGVPSVRDWLHLWKAVRNTSCSLHALERLS